MLPCPNTFDQASLDLSGIKPAHKKFGWIEQLHIARASNQFIGGKAAIWILQREQDINSPVHAYFRYWLRRIAANNVTVKSHVGRRPLTLSFVGR